MIRVAWIAIEGMAQDAILESLNFVEASESDRRVRAGIYTLANGWIIVPTIDVDFPSPERMRTLSAQGQAVGCAFDDVPMASRALGYRQGRPIWSVEHDGGSQGVRHMAVTGEPPAQWPAILQRLTADQDAEDAGEAMVDCLFDAPMELAKALTGYRYGEAGPNDEPVTFSPLKPKSGRGLLGLFRRA